MHVLRYVINLFLQVFKQGRVGADSGATQDLGLSGSSVGPLESFYRIAAAQVVNKASC